MRGEEGRGGGWVFGELTLASMVMTNGGINDFSGKYHYILELCSKKDRLRLN